MESTSRPTTATIQVHPHHAALRGRDRRRAKDGLLYGLGFGALGGAGCAAALSFVLFTFSYLDDPSAIFAAIVGFTLSAVFGSIVGAVLGSLGGGIIGLVLGAAGWQRAASGVAAAAATSPPMLLLILGPYDDPLYGTIPALTMVLVFGAIGFITGKAYERRCLPVPR